MSEQRINPDNDLILKLVAGLEVDPNRCVSTFIKHLAVPLTCRSAMRSALGQILLTHHQHFLDEFGAEFTAEVNKRFPSMPDGERLMEVFIAMIEVRLASYLAEMNTPRISNHAFDWCSRVLVGAMSMHMMVGLPYKPHSPPPLWVVRRGHSHVILDGTDHTFRENLRFQTVYQIVEACGDAFLDAYVQSYVRSDDVQVGFEDLRITMRNSSTPPRSDGPAISSLFAMSVRSFELRGQIFRKDLGDRIASVCKSLVESPEPLAVAKEATLLQTVDRPGVDRQVRQTWRGERDLADHQMIFLHDATPTRVEDSDPNRDQYLLEDILAPFVTPDLLFHNFSSGEQVSTPLDEVAREIGQPGRHRCLLTAPPNGGKWRIQRVFAKHRAVSRLGFDLFINLEHFGRSGIPYIYQYAAREFVKMMGLGGDRLRGLEDHLKSLDIDGQLLWHLENWDDVPGENRLRVAYAISPLRSYVLSTTDPRRAKPVLESYGVERLDGAITTLPFGEEQVAEYIERYAELDDKINVVGIQRLVAQLPGLASLPGGIEYICEHSDSGVIIDLLLGYISKDQRNPISVSDVKASDSVPDWGSPYVGDALRIVMRMIPLVSEPIDAAVLSHLTVRGVAARFEGHDKGVVKRWFDSAVRGRLLQVNDDDTPTYRFVVPEVAYFFIAVRMGLHIIPSAFLRRAYERFNGDRSDPVAQFVLAYAAWNAERAAMSALSKGPPGSPSHGEGPSAAPDCSS